MRVKIRRCLESGKTLWTYEFYLSPEVFILRVNVTTGYTLVKRRHSRLPTYLQRETDTADWSTPTFNLPCPKNGGVYPATSTFLQNCTPIFQNVPRPGGKWDSSIGYFLRMNHFPLPAKKDTKTEIFLPGNRHCFFTRAVRSYQTKSTKTSTLPFLNIQWHTIRIHFNRFQI